MKTNKLLLTAVITACTLSATLNHAAEDVSQTKYQVVIIQGAGYLPNTKKPEGVDAFTKATTKVLNTYVLTTALTKKLNALNMNVTMLPYTECAELKSLYTSPEGKRRHTDIVIFAGPSHFGKQPSQLTKLYRKLEIPVKKNPKLLCSTLVPAWYPDTKGKGTIKVAAKAFLKAGAGVVEGVSILTPRKDKKGATAKEVDKALTEFAERLSQALISSTK